MTKVSAVSLNNYNQQQADETIKKLIDDLGGIDKFVKDGDNVFIKVNLVLDMHPDKAGTTHPALVTALVRLINSHCNARVVVGDSSGGPFTAMYMNPLYKRTMMTYVTENSNCTLNDDFTCSSSEIGGRVLFNTEIINAFNNCDVCFNFTKLKTHTFAGYSGSVKNLYGLVGGLVKVELHSRFPDIDTFANALIDIEQFASKKIVLHLIDAVVGMEGEGPTNGTPREIGQVLAGTNPYLLDYVACSLFSQPFSQPVLSKALERDLIDSKLSNLEFDLEGWKKNYINDFKSITVVSGSLFGSTPMWLRKFIRRNITRKVGIRDNCRACGKCVAHCPAGALKIVNGKAKIDQSKCIRCYCCQELCKFDAINLTKPLGYRITTKLSGLTKNNKK